MGVVSKFPKSCLFMGVAYRGGLLIYGEGGLLKNVLFKITCLLKYNNLLIGSVAAA